MAGRNANDIQRPERQRDRVGERKRRDLPQQRAHAERKEEQA